MSCYKVSTMSCYKPVNYVPVWFTMEPCRREDRNAYAMETISLSLLLRRLLPPWRRHTILYGKPECQDLFVVVSGPVHDDFKPHTPQVALGLFKAPIALIVGRTRLICP